MKNSFFLILFALVLQSAVAQVSTADDTLQIVTSNPEQSFFEIQQEFNDYWGSKDVEGGYYMENGVRKKASGWKQFKRWEWYWEKRIDPQTGRFPSVNRAEIYQQIEDIRGNRNSTGNWQNLGPTTSAGGYAGIGRLNCVGFREGDNSTLYAGAPSGGLWKTTDGGSNWTVLTDDNAVLGVSDVVVVEGGSTSTDVVYIATGDRDGGSMHSLNGGQHNDNNSIGVLKSTDGGTSWSTTALAYSTSQGKTTNRLLQLPSNNSVIYAATTDGVFKTTNGGSTVPLIYSGAEFISMEFKPDDPTIMYGGTRGGKIYKSTNSGVSWTAVLTVGSASRVQLAVTIADVKRVYAVVATSDRKLEGIYKSTNSGTSFTKVYDGSTAGHYLLGYYCDGSVDGGQGTYDLCLAADPNNAGTVFLGGVNTWKSTDGGSNWESSNMWTSYSGYNSCGSPVVHADKHFLAFQNGSSSLFECNDGGLYKTLNGGSTWVDISNGMEISQLYRLGVSQTSSSEVIIGLQDNGTKSLSSGSWSDVIGGDGMECAIDPTDATTQYGELYYGDIYRTTNSWSSRTSIKAGLTGSAWWVTPFVIDPNSHTTLYIGYQDVWKSTNQGSHWTKISAWGGSTIRSLAVAQSNSNYIYASTSSSLYKTTIGGTTWTNVSSGLPVAYSYITYISVKDDDPLTAWVSFGQYNSHGVYQTTTGGSTWANISTGLPSIPIMCVIQNKQNTSDIELYAATDMGVYAKVGSANWTLFSGGLPNVVVNELEIYYNSSSPNLSRLRAATSGRGLWESELYSLPSAPVADFSADRTNSETGVTVSFTDLSYNIPTSWSWSFSPSTVSYVEGTSSSSQNPQVEFNSPGDYTVQLTSTNAYGSDTENKTDYISITSPLQTYCPASGGGLIYISGVELGTISNTGTGNNGYANYTIMSTDLIPASNYNITITYYGSSGMLEYSGIMIWIDWNQDGDFDDTDENVLCDLSIITSQGTYSIAVPSTALMGATTMRVRMKYYSTTCESPCGTTTYGEVEDYKINIVLGSNTWLGNSSDWNSTSNWSDGIVPNSSYEVTIPSGVISPIIPSGTDAKCYSITLENGAIITINGNLEVEK